MLQVHGTGYEIGKNDITYKFTVKLANQEWDIFRVYKDFQKLDSDLASKYGKPNLPQLTGTVFLRVLSDATGTKRLPKLEDYLTQVLSSWKASFKNPKYFEIPNPKGSRFPNILIEITMAQFLEIGENYEAVVEDEEEEEEDEDEEEADQENNNNNTSFEHNENDDDAGVIQGRSETMPFDNDNDQERQQQKVASAAKPVAVSNDLGWSDDEDAEPVTQPTPSQQRFILEEEEQKNVASNNLTAATKITSPSATTPTSKSNATNQNQNNQTTPQASNAMLTRSPQTSSTNHHNNNNNNNVTPRKTATAKDTPNNNNNPKLNSAKLANIISQQTQKASAAAQVITKKEKKNMGNDFEVIDEDEVVDDFDVVDTHKDTFEATHVLTQCRTMTSEIDIFVKDYVIHPSAYIEYNFQVTFCGFSWKVTKRFSEFAAFYENLMKELKGTEYINYIPPMDDVAFPAWRKCDPDVAETRSVWLTNFFKIIAPMMDEWFTAGNLTHFKIRRRAGEEEDELDRYASNSWIKVAVNRILFDWFHFANYISEFSAIDAEKVARENERLLPSFMQKNLENVRKEEERVQREKNIAYRNSFMEKMTEDEFQDLIRIISSFDDDRHCLALLEFFVKNGYYYPGKTRVERIQELEGQKAIQEKRRKEAQAINQQMNQSTTSDPLGNSGSGSGSISQHLLSVHHHQNTPNKYSDHHHHHNNNNLIHQDDTPTTSAASKWRQSRKKMSAQTNNTSFSSSANFNNSSSSSTNFNNSNGITNHSFTRNIDQSMYFRSGGGRGGDEDDEKDNVNMDIFDRMQQNSAIFGAPTSTKDFTSLVTSAVNAAKDQLRGRTRSATIKNVDGNNGGGHYDQDSSSDDDDDNDKNHSAKNKNNKYDKKKLSRPCGLTSLQIARVAEAIPFNDTRAASITILSPILLDMDNLNKIYETLIYDWETAETTLIELLTKKEAPEKFKFTASPTPVLPM